MNDIKQTELDFSGQPNTIGKREIRNKKGEKIAILTIDGPSIRRISSQSIGVDPELGEEIFRDKTTGELYILHDAFWREQVLSKKAGVAQTKVAEIITDQKPKSFENVAGKVDVNIPNPETKRTIEVAQNNTPDPNDEDSDTNGYDVPGFGHVNLPYKD